MYKIPNLIASLLVALFTPSLYGQTWRGADMSAELYQFNVYSPENTYKQTISLGKNGMRSEGEMLVLGSAPEPIQLITNYTLKKCWLVRPKSKIYIEDVIDIETGACRISYPMIPDPDYHMRLWGGVACEGYQLTERMGTETIQGRFTEKWACGDPTKQFAVLQWYDPRLKLVVREGTRDGDIYELRRISSTQHSSTLFDKPTGLRKVPVEKFFPDMPNPVR